MTPPRLRVPRKPHRSFPVGRLAVALLGTIAAPVLAAEPVAAPVYKCLQPGGAVLYADYPCKGGAVVDIRPGVAAPDASEQLARARDELDRAAARRQAIDAAAAMRRSESDWQRDSAAPAVDVAAYAPDTYFPAYGYYVNPANAHAHRPKPRHVDPPRIADRRVPAVIRRP